MGEALVAGLLQAGWAAADEMVVVEPVAARRDQLAARFPGLGVSATAVGGRRGGAGGEAGRRRGRLPGHRRRRRGPGAVDRGRACPPPASRSGWATSVPVVRAMPNTPALVGAGAAAIAAGHRGRRGRPRLGRGHPGARSGVVERVPEQLLDAVTGLSGSGPAYVFLVAEALIEAGVLNGLPRPTATRRSSSRRCSGSARLLAESGDEPGGAAGGGHVARRHHRRRPAGPREPRPCAAPSWRRSTAATERSRELGQA